MVVEHADAAVTIEPDTARELLVRATASGRRLLELFARRQLLDFDELRGEFQTSQNGLNALLGHLTLEFQQIQKGAGGFYIYIPRLRSWAIAHASSVNLRQAIREDEKARQKKLEFG